MGTEAIIPSVAAANPWFSRKLAHLIKTRWHESQSALAAKIGVSRQVLSSYIRGSIPPPHVVLQLAKKLEVDHALAWLFDEDDHTLEPPEPKAADLSRVDVSTLRQELTRRYLEVAEPLHDSLVEGQDYAGWESVAVWCLCNQGGQPLPLPIRHVLIRAFAIREMAEGLWVFGNINDVDIYAVHSESRGVKDAKYPARELTPEALVERWEKLQKDHPGLESLLRYLEVCEGRVPDDDWKPAKVDPTLPPGAQPFWEWQAPYRLARLVTHPNIADHPKNAKYNQVWKYLKESGYLDSNGRPTEAPGDIDTFEPPAGFTPPTPRKRKDG